MVFVYGPFLSFYSVKEYLTNSQTYQMFWSITLFRFHVILPGVFTENKQVALLGSLWTLPYEFSMYIGIMILGAFKILDKRYFNLFIWLLLLIVCVFYPTYLHTFIDHHYIPFLRLTLWSTVEFSCFFLGGMLLYQFRDLIKFRLNAFIFILLLFIVNVHFNNQLLVRTIIYGLFPYVIFYLSNLKGLLNRFGKYGDFSYGIYIYGFPVQQMLVFLTKNKISVLNLQVLSFVIVIPLAFLSWHLVEKQALKFKNVFGNYSKVKI